ncbi:hypothetical protein Tco_0429650 [Tanacetum coccineum]
MSGTIPAPLVPNYGNTRNTNRVEDAFQTDTTNNTGTNNVTQNVVTKDLLQLFNSRGGSHIINVSSFDVDDFSSWKDRFLVYLDGHEGPFETRDTNIAALILKFNASKALEGEKVLGTFTKLKILLNDLETKCVSIPQAEVNATIVTQMLRKTQGAALTFLVDLNVEFHDRAILVNQKRFYKRLGRDEESISSKDEGVSGVKALMDIVEVETTVGKTDASKVTLDQLLTEQVPGNIVRALGGRGKRKETISSKEIKPLPPLLKLSGVGPIGTSIDVIPPADLIQTLTIFDKTKQVIVKEPSVKTIKKKAQTKSPAIPNLSPNKKADSSTEQLLLTLIEEDYLKRFVWYLDSGCSRHMTRVKQYLHTYSKESGPKVVFGDNSSSDAKGYCIVK